VWTDAVAAPTVESREASGNFGTSGSGTTRQSRDNRQKLFNIFREPRPVANRMRWRLTSPLRTSS